MKDPYLSAEPDHGCYLESWLGQEAMRWLWQDGRYDTFSELRQILKSHKDVRVYQEGPRLYFCTMSINAHADVEVDIRFDTHSPTPEIAAARCWVSCIDESSGKRVYSDPPFIEIGCRNPRGWGVLERPGYVAAANACGFGLSVLTAAKKWLDANPIVVY